MKNRKVVLVGDGAVGSSFAYSLIQTVKTVEELVIVDRNEAKAQGDVWDLQDLTPLTSDVTIRIGDYSDAADAGIVVITAGVPRKPGETRLDLVNKNVKILRSIVEPVVASGFNGIFVVSANPVDILTTMTQKISGFPKERVIGTGTFLDKARLNIILGDHFGYKPSEIDALVLGEHGDTSFVNFDEAKVNGKRLLDEVEISADLQAQIEAEVRGRGGKIIGNKGATFYGVAYGLATIVRAILEKNYKMMVVSAPLTGQYGVNDLYFGTPAVLNSTGIAQVIETELSKRELSKMSASAQSMQDVLKELD